MTVENSPLTTTANAGKIALVTGGGSGIGRATALELGRTGARVVVCGRRREPVDETCDLLRAAGAEALSVRTDLREPDQVDRLLDAALERFGRIDILVNNAGGQFMAPAEEITLKGWRAVHRVSLDAVWDITQKVAERSMIPNRAGVVVFIGFSPEGGSPGFAHATAARGAVESLTSALALEWSRFGIRTVCVSAGHIESEGMRENYPAELQAAWAGQVPMKRYGTAAECATVIAFLTSSGASYVTGTTLYVDGGVNAWGNASTPPDLDPDDGPPTAVPWRSTRET
ncbi:MAG: SDR family oxidoreductase [Proteobacteria bacterium]|nr:SDR family oxidoreductase [Pseudomonadota bacterium]